MIKYRQKKFAIPAAVIAGANIAGTAVGLAGMKQSADQAKEAEEQAEEQKAALDRQTKALNKIAKAAKNNPEVARQVMEQKQMSITRLFAIPAGMAKNVAGFAKDIWKTQKGNVGSAAKAGLGFGAMTWAGNRLTTSIKDHDEGHDEQNRSFLKKAALGTAAVGGGILAARKGAFGKGAQTFMKTGGGAKALNAVKTGVNPIVRDQKTGAIQGKQTALKVGMNGLFIGMPVLGYMGQRKQQQDQAAQTQKAYSDNDGKKSHRGLLTGLGATAATIGTIALARRGNLGAGAQKFIGNTTAHTGGILKSMGAGKAGRALAKDGSMTWAKGVERAGALNGKTVGQMAAGKYRSAAAPNKISSGISKAGSFMGFYGKGGTQAVQNTAGTLAKSDNAISQKVGGYLQRHKTIANVGAGVGSLAVGGTIMSAGNKPFELADKHAYDYEKQQAQQVQ